MVEEKINNAQFNVGIYIRLSQEDDDKKYESDSESVINQRTLLKNYVKENNYTEVVVCESQINTLTCWTWGIPAIGLIGTGSGEQYKILKHSGIRNYHLALDGDLAGEQGTRRFIKNMPKDVMIDVIPIPQGKDVNDLSKDEFLKCFNQRYLL